METSVENSPFLFVLYLLVKIIINLFQNKKNCVQTLQFISLNVANMYSLWNDCPVKPSVIFMT